MHHVPMKRPTLSLRVLPALLALAVGCDDSPAASPDHPNARCSDYTAASCVEIAAGDSAALLEATNLLGNDGVLVLGLGTYELNNQVTIRNADGVTFVGQGMGMTILDFANTEAQVNGVDVVGDRFVIEGMTLRDAKKDALRIEDSDEVTIRAVETTWSGGALSTNGAYGIYPVKSTNVLVEDCETSFAADAGLYVGQSRHVVVRNNRVHGNVAGLEIENTQFADVYDNEVYDNTGGLVIFDLPGNPVVGRDIHVHDNTVRDNNRTNFAPGGVVAEIPPGTGTFAMASRRVLIENNTYANNNTVDIAIISGAVVEANRDNWALSMGELVGDWDDLGLDTEGDNVFNDRSYNIRIAGNSHSDGGMMPGAMPTPELGMLLLIVYGNTPVDNILYGAGYESMFSATDAAGNSNDNRLCFGGDSGSFASLNIGSLISGLDEGIIPSLTSIYRPEGDPAPFDCDTLEGGPIPTIDIPQI